MKEIYRQAQIRQDSRIRELEDCNMRLKEELVGFKLSADQDTVRLASDLEQEVVCLSDQENRSRIRLDKPCMTIWEREDLVKQILYKDNQLGSRQVDYKRVMKKMHLKEEECQIELADLQLENSRLQTDTMNLRMEVEMGRALIKEIDMRMMEVESENAETLKQLKSVRLETSATRESFSLQLTAKNEQIKSVCKELETARDEISLLKEQVELEKKENHTNSNRFQEICRDKSSLEAELSSSEAKIKSLSESVSMAQTQLKERGDQIMILQEEVKEANEALNVSRQETRFREEELAASKTEHDNAVRRLMKSVQGKDQSLHERKKRIDSLEVENAQIRNELKVSCAENVDLLNFKRIKEEELEKLERDLSESRLEASQLHYNMLERIETGEAFFQGDHLQTNADELVLCLSDKLEAMRSILLSSLVTIKRLKDENGILVDLATQRNKSLEYSESRNDKYHKGICETGAYVIALKEQVLNFGNSEGADQSSYGSIECPSHDGISDLKSLNAQVSWLIEELSSWLDRTELMNTTIRRLSKKKFCFEKEKELGDSRSASLRLQCDVVVQNLTSTVKSVDGMREKLRMAEEELCKGKHEAVDIERACLNRNYGVEMDCDVVSCDDSQHNLAPHISSADEDQGIVKHKHETIRSNLFEADSLFELSGSIQSTSVLAQEKALHEIRRLDSALELVRFKKQVLEEKIGLLNNEIEGLSSRRTYDAAVYELRLDEITSERDSLLISCKQSETITRELVVKISTLVEKLRQSELLSSKLERRVSELTQENSNQIEILNKEKEELRKKLKLGLKEADGVQEAGSIKQEFRMADLKQDIDSLILETKIVSQDLEVKDYAVQSASNEFDTAQGLNILLSTESGCLYSKINLLEGELRIAKNETAKLKGLVLTTPSEKRSRFNTWMAQKDCSQTLGTTVEVLVSNESPLEDELKASKRSLSVSLLTLKDQDSRLESIGMVNMRLRKKIYCFKILNQRLVAEKEDVETQNIFDLDSSRRKQNGLGFDLLSLQDMNRRLRKTICCFDIKTYALVSSRQTFEIEVADLDLQDKSLLLQEKLGTTQSKLSSVTLELNEKSGTIKALEMSQRNSRTDIFRLIRLITKLRANNALIETQKHSCQQTNAKLSFESEELNAEKEELAAKLKDSAEYSQIQMAMNDDINKGLLKLQKEYDETQELMRTIRFEKRVSSEQNEEMAMEMSNLKDSLDLASAREKKLQGALAATESQLQDQEQSIKKLTRRYTDDMKAASESILNSKENERRILFQANARIVSLTVQNKKLRDEKNSAALTNERITNESEVSILRTAELEHALLNAKSEISILRKKMEDFVDLETSKVEAITRESEHLQIQLKKLHVSPEKKNFEITTKNSYFEMRENEIADNFFEMSNRIKSLSNLLSEQEVEKRCLECKVKHLTELCAQESTEKSKAIHELEEMKCTTRTSWLRSLKMKTLMTMIQYSRNALEDSSDEMKRYHSQQLAVLQRDHRDELKYWKEKREEMDSNLSEVRGKLRVACEEIQQYRSKICKMDVTQKKLETALVESEDTISELKRELLQIEDELSDGQSDEDSIDGEVRRLTKGELAAECLALQDDLAEAEAKVFKLTGAISAQRFKLSSMGKRVKQKEIESEALLDQNAVLEDKIQQLNRQKALIDEVSKRRILEIEEKHDSKTLALEQLHEQWRSERESTNRYIVGLKKSFAAVRAECVVAIQESKVLKKKNHHLETRVRLLDKKYSDIERESNRLRSDLAQVDSQMNLKKDVICDLEEEISTLQRENARLFSANDVLTSEFQGKETELSLFHQSFASLNVENKGLKSRLQEKGSLIVSLEEMLGRLKARIDELELERGEQITTIANLQQKDEGLDNRLAILNEEKDQLLSRLKSQDAVVFELKEEIRGLQDERASLSTKCDDFKNTCEGKASEISLLVSRVSHMTRERESLSSTIGALKREVDNRQKNEEEFKSVIHQFALCLNQVRAGKFNDEETLGGPASEVSGQANLSSSLIHLLSPNHIDSIVLKDIGLENGCCQGHLSSRSSSIVSSLQSRRLMFEIMINCNDKGIQLKELVNICSTENEFAGLVLWIKEYQRFFKRTSLQALDLTGLSSSYLTNTVRKNIGSLLFTAAKVQGGLYRRNLKASNSLRNSAPLGDEGEGKVDIASGVNLSLFSDPSGLREAIEALESDIRRLLNRLEEANSALLDKDILYLKMEKLAAQNESERVSLERKLFSLEAQLDDLKHHTCSSTIGGGESMEISCLTPPVFSKTNAGSSQIAGARMLCMALEKQSRELKSSSFRKWFYNASTMKVISGQKITASALAQQLEITREKLVVLKSHLQKGRHVQGGQSEPAAISKSA